MSSVDQRVARGEATRTLILDAARDALRELGYAATTTRGVAERAGVQLSLVHYHYRGKAALLLAVLDRENERLLARQQALYGGSEPLADKWRTACAYLQEDLRSGYVRILWELWAAGLADPLLAQRWRDSIAGWRELLAGVAERWAAEHDLELPMAPRALATLVVNAFEGAEVELLAGVAQEDAPHHEALAAVGELIERIEAGSGRR